MSSAPGERNRVHLRGAVEGDRKERMSPNADLVKKISATSFKEAIDLMTCLAVLREGNSLVMPRALEAANAALAASIVQKALLEQVLMTVERAFAPVNRPRLRPSRSGGL
jgi:hypothetical protein